MSDAQAKYREQLADLEQKAQEAFDRTVLSLSGGALGVSFAFLDKFIGQNGPRSTPLLYAAWASWTLSVAAVLLSHYFSTLAIRRALIQVDTGAAQAHRVGGVFDVAVVWLNGSGALLFVVGVSFMGFFVFSNLR